MVLMVGLLISAGGLMLSIPFALTNCVLQCNLCDGDKTNKTATADDPRAESSVKTEKSRPKGLVANVKQREESNKPTRKRSKSKQGKKDKEKQKTSSNRIPVQWKTK